MLKGIPMVTTSSIIQCKGIYQNRQDMLPHKRRVCFQVANGFLLIEIMIAMVILTTGSLVVAWYQGHASMVYHDARLRMQALASARSVGMRILQGESALQGTAHDGDISISWRCVPYEGLSRAQCMRLGFESAPPPFVAVMVTAMWRGADAREHTLALPCVVRQPEEKRT